MAIRCTGCGFSCHLCGVDEKRLHTDPILAGQLFESFVTTEICKQISWSAESVSPYHYRTQSGDEVDLVLENRSGQVVGVAIKLTNSITPHDYKGLTRLRDALGERFLRGILLHTGAIPLGENLIALPVNALWTTCPPPHFGRNLLYNQANPTFPKRHREIAFSIDPRVFQSMSGSPLNALNPNFR